MPLLFWTLLIAFLHGESPEVFILVACGQGFDVDRRRTGREVEVADQIDVAPGDGGGAFEDFDGLQVACCQLLLVYRYRNAATRFPFEVPSCEEQG